MIFILAFILVIGQIINRKKNLAINLFILRPFL
jgi:hypothetical protein